jgi:hypothetical protein
MSEIRQSAVERKVASDDEATKKPAVTLPATVQKLVKDFGEPEKAEIAIDGADDLYKEIRIDNTLEDAKGEKVRLKEGAKVDVTVEAPPDAVEKKPA